MRTYGEHRRAIGCPKWSERYASGMRTEHSRITTVGNAMRVQGVRCSLNHALQKPYARRRPEARRGHGKHILILYIIIAYTNIF
jgi:hypothetical protein